MLIRGTGYERRRIGKLQCDPACLFSWMRYLLKHNFMVVAICSPAYLTPMQVLYPDLLKMLAQYGLIDFPLELLDRRNTYRILETAHRVGGLLLTTNEFKEHHDDPEILELVNSIIVAPEYAKAKLKDSEWFYKTRDGNHWMSYYCPKFVEHQLQRPPTLRGRLFLSPGDPCYDITARYRKSFTELRRDKLIAILDYAIMERMKTPCAYIKPQSSKSWKLRVLLMKELEMQLSVKRWRELLNDVKLRRMRERAEMEAKNEWARRLKNRADSIEKRNMYRETEMERLRQQYRRRAARQMAEREQEVFDLVEGVRKKILRKLKKEMEKLPKKPVFDVDAIYKAELEIWQNYDRPRRLTSPPSSSNDPLPSVIFHFPQIHKDPVEFVELFFKWYTLKLKRQFKETNVPVEELIQYRLTEEFPPDREMLPWDKKECIEQGEYRHGRRLRRGGHNWTRKQIEEGIFDDLRVGPFMSRKKYVAF
ncbi:hypothetical protein PENTCL1PPCAC_29926 [Pristionchus entomophagus]|uniref:Uncharacterized protein n=1 Tax=Pristionchus entomophagus TaxID=358040 RepID=A0AAV5UN81_9BILA|nr:hypothetical protein PENTCL1PPCAC_29926 [Pristionchus entomophagus]